MAIFGMMNSESFSATTKHLFYECATIAIKVIITQ